MNIIEHALSYHAAGLRVIPTTPAKTPIAGFDLSSRFHGSPPSVIQIQQEFTKTDWISVAGGLVLCIDIDAKAKGPVDDACREVSDLWKTYGFTPYIESTLSGGRHIVIWVPNPKRCPGSKKIVKRYVSDCPAKDKNLAFIETKGFGGYFITYPTPNYNPIEGSLLNKIMGSQDQFEDAYDEMIQLSQKWLVINEESVKSATNIKIPVPQTINECLESQHIGPPKDKAEKPDYVEVGIFEDFRGQTDPIKLIESFGGTLIVKKDEGIKQKGDFIFFTRPDKPKGTSASYNTVKKYFRCHTSNWPPFEEDTTYTLEGAYCFFHHNGDFKKASQDLKEKGFGKFKPITREDIAEINVPDRKHELLVKKNNPYPEKFWPQPLRDMIFQLARELQMPMPMVATTMLGAMSVIPARNECFVNWCGRKALESLNLWTLYLDMPSSGKSTLFKILKDGILKIEELERTEAKQEDHRRQVRLLQLEEALKEAKQEKNYDEVVNIKESIKSLEKPIIPTIFVNDFTPEKLGELFSVNKALLVLSAESQFIENLLPRYSETEQVSLFLSSWSGDEVRIHRSNKEKSEIVIKKPLLSMACLIQPDALIKLSKIENARTLGIHSRFLWNATYNPLGYRDMSVNPNITEELVKPWEDACIALNKSKHRVLDLSREASEILCSRAQRMEELKRDGNWGENYADIIGKLQKGQTSRIAAILHLLSESPSNEISGETMTLAADLAIYYLVEAYSALNISGEPARWQSILKWAEKHPIFTELECKQKSYAGKSIPMHHLRPMLEDMTLAGNLTFDKSSGTYKLASAKFDILAVINNLRGSKHENANQSMLL